MLPFLIGALVVGAIALANRTPTPNPATAPTQASTNASAAADAAALAANLAGVQQNTVPTAGSPATSTDTGMPVSSSPSTDGQGNQGSGTTTTTTSETGSTSTTTTQTDPSTTTSPPGQPAVTQAPSNGGGSSVHSSPGDPTPWSPGTSPPPTVMIASIDEAVVQQLGTNATKQDYSQAYASAGGPSGHVF